MDKFVDYKEATLGDKVCWDVDRDLVRGGVGNEIGWRPKIEAIKAEEEKPKK